MKLYEISNEFLSVFDQLSEDGEISEEMMANLDSIKDDFEKKAISVASYIKNIEAEENAIAQAIDDMRARKLKLTKKVESLTEYLQFNLQSLNYTEIKSSPYFKIRLKLCPQSVEIVDESLIPPEFLREKLVVSVDKMKLKDALNEGMEISGAVLQRKLKLEIK